MLRMMMFDQLPQVLGLTDDQVQSVVPGGSSKRTRSADDDPGE